MVHIPPLRIVYIGHIYDNYLFVSSTLLITSILMVNCPAYVMVADFVCFEHISCLLMILMGQNNLYLCDKIRAWRKFLD